MATNRRSPSTSEQAKGGLLGLAGLLAGVPLGLAASWLAYSRWGIDHQRPLPPALEAERLTLMDQTGEAVNVYRDTSGSGRPLVLIHSVNAAASAYEMRPIFEHYRGKRPVYALDLPGFGLSARTDRIYDAPLCASAIVELLKSQLTEAADVVALSLSSEFAARAVDLAPNQFHSLVMISPSGFNPPDSGRSTQRVVENGNSATVYRLISLPIWGRALYDLIATRRSIAYFLRQSFVGDVPPELVDYAYATAHQPGAHYAPLRFISGLLFTPQARETLYAILKLPVLVVYDRDAFSRFDMLPQFVQEHPNWQAMRLQSTLGLPQFEAPSHLCDVLDEFWGALAAQEEASVRGQASMRAPAITREESGAGAPTGAGAQAGAGAQTGAGEESNKTASQTAGAEH